MKPLSSTGFALLGAGLIAISYGLARFAFGLFVPPIRDELGLAPSTIGIIGALPLISFLLATLVAPLTTHYLGARNAAVLSGVFGVGGLDQPGIRRVIARRGGVRLRHQHRPDDAGAHGGHAGPGEALAARRRRHWRPFPRWSSAWPT